jgi:hypothetical protein
MERIDNYYQRIWEVWNELDECWKAKSYWINIHRIEDTEPLIRALKKYARTGRTEYAIKAIENYVTALKFAFILWRDDYNADFIGAAPLAEEWKDKQEFKYKFHNTLLKIKYNTLISIASQDNRLGCGKKQVETISNVFLRRLEKESL